MYKELGVFLKAVATQRSIWKDGEVWTSLGGAVPLGIWFYVEPGVVDRIRVHFGDLLTISSIVFGFVLTALVYYINASATWSDDKSVETVAERLIDWHVWTILWILVLIGYTLFLWAAGPYLQGNKGWVAIQFGILALLLLYNGFQILNHALTIWWTFRQRHRLRGDQ